MAVFRLKSKNSKKSPAHTRTCTTTILENQPVVFGAVPSAGGTKVINEKWPNGLVGSLVWQPQWPRWQPRLHAPPRHQPSGISHQASAIRHQPPAISHQPPAISDQLSSAINHQPSAINYQPCSTGPCSRRTKSSSIRGSSRGQTS